MRSSEHNRAGIGSEKALIFAAIGEAITGLAVACWPGPAVGGMLFYSIAVALYLSYLGLFAGLTGILLWLAIALHAFLAALLGRVWLVGNQRSSGGDNSKV